MHRPHVAIWGWHHDSNKGDAAILRGLLTLMESPSQLDVTLIAGVRRGNPSFEDLLRFPLPHGLRARITPALVGIDRDDKGLVRVGRGLIALVQLASLLAVARLGLAEHVARLRLFVEADFFVGKGGHYIYAREGWRGALGLLLSLTPALIASAMGKRMYLTGVTVGPFPSEMSRIIARGVFLKCESISVRDASSLTALLELGLDDKQVEVSTDLAFALTREASEPLNPRTLFVNVRGVDPSSGDDSLEAWQGMMQSVVMRAREFGLTARLVPFVTAAGTEATWIADRSSEDDRSSTQRLFACLGEPQLSLDGIESLGPSQSLVQIAGAAGGIAVRLHAGILSIVAGIPCVLIDYFGTKAQVFRTLGLDDWLTDFDRLREPEELDRVARLLCDFAENPAIHRRRAAAACDRAKSILAKDQTIGLLTARLSEVAK